MCIYDEIDDIRDHFIIHKPETQYAISKKEAVIKVLYSKRRNNKQDYKEPSNRDIKNYSNELLKLLDELDQFLSINKYNIPFQK